VEDIAEDLAEQGIPARVVEDTLPAEGTRLVEDAAKAASGAQFGS